MKIETFETKCSMGKAAAEKAAKILIDAIKEKGEATFIVATGASQFEFLEDLTSISSINWSKTTMFHLDEYVGLPETHPASFRKYLKERLINKVHPGNVHLIKGDAEDPESECERLGKIIEQKEIDVAFVGIGENGHLAFNDPPADFDTKKPYLVVELDDACRRQQLGEGWFKSLNEVPYKAISMSINQIMKSKNVICTVPDSRKSRAVRDCLECDISACHPASILRKHKKAFLFLDKNSAKLLKEYKFIVKRGKYD
ncbi:glucosamine-6-phosphate deaminase [Candidatus Atribacteria bacterium 1244-E10-H5-B2]|nr:MAG: glucosamine-6-phosphate deaminase [Candidatus Atribacteria bacterium 1244-E10-H5-B2]